MASANEESSKKFVEFREFIDYQIEQTRKNVRATDLMTATAGGLAIVFAYLLTFVVLDHWVIDGGFSPSARIWMLAFAVVFTIGWITWRVSRPFMRQVTRLFAAKTLETAQPRMRDSLFTLVDLRTSNREIRPEVISSLEKRAAVNLSKTDVDHAVDRRDLMRVSYALLAVVVLFCLYSLFSPKKISSSVWRALIPAADIEAPTKTVISNIEPGDTEVLARTQLEVSAFISGDIPEEVLLKYTTSDRSVVDEAITMRETDDGLGKFVGTINGENGRGILQNFTYKIEAGDDQSNAFRVTVRQAPSAHIKQVELTYPGYMKLEPRTQTTGDVNTWEGTTVKLTATTNMPVKSATVRFSDTEDLSQKAEEIMMNVVDGTTLVAEWPPLKFRSDGSHPKFFWIDCRSEAGEADPAPVIHQLKIRPDQPPYIRLVDPTINLEMPANGVVPILVEARDPDFRLRYLTLRVEKQGETIFVHPLFEGEKVAVRKQYDLALENLRLQPNDQIMFWVEARDNKQPLGNRSNTPKLMITITPPVTPEEVQKQLEDDKQTQQQKVDAEQQESNEAQSQDTQDGDGQNGNNNDSDSGSDSQTSDDMNSDDGMSTDSESSEDSQSAEQSKEGADGDSNKPGKSGSKPSENPGENGDQQMPGENDGENTGENTGEQPSDEDSEQFSKDGSEDDLVLEELIKRQQEKEKQDKQQANPQDGNDGNSGDQNKDDANNPSEQNRDDKNPNDKNDPNTDGGNSADPSEMQGDENMDQNSGSENTEGPKSSDGMPNGANDDGMGGSEDGVPSKPEGTPEDTKNGNANSPAENPSDPMNAGDMNESDNPGEKGSPADPMNPHGGETKPGMGENTGDNADNGNGDPMTENGKPGDGDEKGMGKPADDPNAESTPAKNKIEREPNTDPTTRPSDRDPMSSDPNMNDAKSPNKNNDSPNGSKNKDNSDSETAPPEGKSGGSKNPNQADPASKTSDMGDSPKNSNPTEDNGTKPTDKPPAKTDGQPDAADDDLKGKGKPASQKNDQPKNGGEEGSNKQNTEGMTGGDEKGPGDKSDKPGDNQKSNSDQKGKPGQEPGKGKQPGQDGKGQQPGGKSPSQDGGKNGKGEGEGYKPGQSEGDGASGNQKSDIDPQNQSATKSGSGKGQNPTGDGKGMARGGAGNEQAGDQSGSGGDGGGGDHSDTPNLEDKKKAANLVLQELKDDIDRGDVDEELLKKLGWTKDDLKKFTDRLAKNLDEPKSDQLTPEEIARQKQFEEMLKGIRLSGDQDTRREGADLESTDVESFAPSQAPAPAQYRELEEAYKRSLSKQRKR